MSETLTETFARFAEDAAFRHWSEGRTFECRTVYVCQDKNVWKFTPEQWWRFVTKAIRNKGVYNLPMTKTLQIADVENEVARDNTIRRVNLNRWTLADWIAELQAI